MTGMLECGFFLVPPLCLVVGVPQVVHTLFIAVVSFWYGKVRLDSFLLIVSMPRPSLV